MKHTFTHWAIVLVLLALMIPVAPLPIAAQGPTPLTPDQARQAAQQRLQTQVNAGRAPGWAEAVLNDPITLYDLSGAVSAYLFPATRHGEPAGYLTVAAVAIPNPVLEFAAEGPHPLAAGPDSAAGHELLSPRPLYLGLLSYAYELAPANGQRRVIDLATGAIQEIAPAQAAVPLINALAASAPAGDSAAAALAYKLIGGVPDWNQFWGSYGCWSGCSPTSGTNVMGYWDQHGYGNLISGSNWQAAVNEMRTHMGTFCKDGGGATYVDRISPGMVSYAQAHGYYFSSQSWQRPSYDSYRAEIDATCPLVVDVIGHATYGDHSVAGVGYDTNGNYLIVHDNWGSTGENVYLRYGAGYSEIFMHPVRLSTYAARWASQSPHPTLRPGQTVQLQVTLQNTGTETWYQSGSNPVRLGTAQPHDRESVFYNPTWISRNRAARLDQASVPPGAYGSFTFSVSVPAGAGGGQVYREYFSLVAENKCWFGDEIGLYWEITMAPAYSCRWVRQTAYPSLHPGDDATLTVWFENTGFNTWTNAGPNPVRLGTSNPRDRPSAFAHSSWIAPNRPAKLGQSSVAPGSQGSFTFQVHVPAAQPLGVYYEYFRPLAENKTWMEDWGVYWQIMVRPTTDRVGEIVTGPGPAEPHSSLVRLYHRVPESGQFALCTEISNGTPGVGYGANVAAGDTNGDGRDEIVTGAGPGPGHEPVVQVWDKNGMFQGVEFKAYPSLPYGLESGLFCGVNVAAGRFAPGMVSAAGPESPSLSTTYTLQAPSQAIGAAPTEGDHPSASYACELVDQEKPAGLIDMQPGQRVTARIRYRNTGIIPWYRDGAQPVRLGTYQPENRASAFYASGTTWITNHRVALNETYVAPGEIGSFSVSFTAPNTPGTYWEYFRPLVENTTWLCDYGVYWYITVRPPAATSRHRIVTGPGPCAANPSLVRVFYGGAAPTGTTTMPYLFAQFEAYPGAHYGVKVAAGDVDGDGYDEIITGPGPDPSNGPHVKVYEGNGAFSGIEFSAYPGLPYGTNPERLYGVNVAAGKFASGLLASAAWSASLPPLPVGALQAPPQAIDAAVADGDQAALAYSCQWVSQDYPAGLIDMQPGQQVVATVRFKNTGTATWERDSSSTPVSLGTHQPMDRASGFYAPGATWLSPNRVALNEATVLPGQIGTFSVRFTAPITPGVYYEYFRPVAENVTWMEDWGVYWLVTVRPPQAARQYCIVTGPGPGADNPSLVRVFYGGASPFPTTSVTAMPYLFHEFEAFPGSGYGVNVATADVDGDGYDEIIAGRGPDPNGNAEVRVFRANGVLLGSFPAYDPATRYGVNVTGGNFDLTAGRATASAGATVSTREGDAYVTVPPGAVSEPTFFTATAITTLANVPPTLGETGHAFAVEARTEAGTPVTSFSQLLTITVYYTETDVTQVNEGSLALRYWDAGSSTWVRITDYNLDAAHNTLTARVSHLTDLALLGDALPRPTVSGVSPASVPRGLVWGFTITGTSFAATPAVAIGARSCPTVTWIASNELFVVTPPDLPVGRYDVRVTNPDGRYGILADGIQVVHPTPTILWVTPAAGQNTGPTEITIDGNSFVATPLVHLGDITCTAVAYVDSTRLRATVPAGLPAGLYDVRVTNPEGSYSSVLPQAFSVTAQPPIQVTTVSPGAGYNHVATAITITGDNFPANPIVSIGATSCTNVQRVSAAQITAVVPAGLAAGTYDVRVTNAAAPGEFGLLPNGFTAAMPPAEPTRFYLYLPLVVRTYQ